MFTCHCSSSSVFFIFFFNDTATTEIYTLSLHDALPISTSPHPTRQFLTESLVDGERSQSKSFSSCARIGRRSEERFSRNAETDLVCRLLLEKKKNPRESFAYYAAASGLLLARKIPTHFNVSPSL